MSASVQHRSAPSQVRKPRKGRPLCALVYRLKRIPSPAQWLAKKIVDTHLSQAEIARRSGVNPTQLNHWLSGQDRIPRHHLIHLAYAIGSPADQDYAPLLKDIEDYLASLHQDCAAFETALASLSGDHEQMSGVDVWTYLVELIDKLLLDFELTEPPIELARLARWYIYVCSGSLRALTAVVADRPTPHLVSPQAITLHLRYPANTVVGALLSPHLRAAVSPPLQASLDAFQALCREDLGKEITRLRKAEQPLELLCYQHALHLLGRYGTPLDVTRVVELTRAQSGSLDPLTRKIAFTGVILSTPNSDLGHRFADELLRDASLAQVNLAFEAYHYGDLWCDVSEMLTTPVPSYPNLLHHIARRLKARESYSALDPVTAVELLQVVTASTTLSCLPSRVQIEVCQTLAAFVQHFEGDTPLKRQLGRILPLLEPGQPST
jgi:transcriptional regulator with XRE-family HTH domain